MTDKAKQGRPKFRPVQPSVTHKTPEDLFYKLARKQTHGYLRGPQQDVLREYAANHTDSPDVAFELPTGTGKTAVGLLVGEWARQPGKRVAYLSLTNQLAGQVLTEVSRLNIKGADLRGTKASRDVAEEGRFRTRAGIAVTTYSNLFNVNPVIQECDLLVFDDAHGGEHFVADMWTVNVRRSTERGLYDELLTSLRSGLSEGQMRAITDKSSFPTVEAVDICGHQECVTALTDVLDSATVESVKYGWRRLRRSLGSCLVLISASEVTIRPIIPPTHTHTAFADAAQRVYMSATLGGASDLRRAYGIEQLKMVRATTPQWGRRYVFVPGVHVSESEATTIVTATWDRLAPSRAVLLAPSERIMDMSFDELKKAATKTPNRFQAQDIAQSVETFIADDNAILTLAGRYDGLDLPDDQCRFLLMWGSPVATHALERHLSERWKLGPILRRRERTRLIQGMGRCTRSATDFAVIVWLGQSLVNAATSDAVLLGMPPELASEIVWGVKQSTSATKSHGDELVDMIVGLLDDAEYRESADAEIASIQVSEPEEEPPQYEQFGIDEVRFARAMWGEDYQRGLQIARSIADQISAPELSGYRAWWWHLTSMAASLARETNAERDALRRGSRCGVNSGWFNRLLRDRGEAPTPRAVAGIEPNAEKLWELFEQWGWAGPRFDQKLSLCLQQLDHQYHVSYHEGLETLGKCFGAETTRVTDQGAPDVVWSFPSDIHFVFEAKTNKKPGGQISKHDLQEAKGHTDWVRAKLCEGRASVTIEPIIVSPETAVHAVGLPFTGGLYHLKPEAIRKKAEEVAETIREIRMQFSGREFASAALEFSAKIRANRMDLESVGSFAMASQLKK